jgi:hypothetical protein
VNYRKALKLCADTIAKHPKDPDLWRVRNRRIIALLGMWKMAADPKYFEQAAKEARALLEVSLPDGADVVANFVWRWRDFVKMVLMPSRFYQG